VFLKVLRGKTIDKEKGKIKAKQAKKPEKRFKKGLGLARREF
jgi:hypothetical protein